MAKIENTSRMMEFRRSCSSTSFKVTINECYGSGIIESGSGSILSCESVSGSGSRVLMTKNWKK